MDADIPQNVRNYVDNELLTAHVNVMRTTEHLRPHFFRGSSTDHVPTFLSKFEDWMVASRIPEDRWCQQFPLYLQDSAYSFFRELDEDVRGDYDALKENFTDRFQANGNNYVLKMRFMDCKQKDHQSLETFLDFFQTGCARYEIPAAERLGLFIKALKPKLQSAVLRQRPETLMAAIAAARTEESCIEIEQAGLPSIAALLQADNTSTLRRQDLISSAQYNRDKEDNSKLLQNILQRLNEIQGQLPHPQNNPPVAVPASSQGNRYPQPNQRPQNSQRDTPNYQYPRQQDRTLKSQLICQKCSKIGHHSISCRALYCEHHGYGQHTSSECYVLRSRQQSPNQGPSNSQGNRPSRRPLNY